MAIYLSNRQKALPINRGKLLRRVLKILKELNLADAELSISVISDEEMREINRQYRGRDKPTNVLSFAQDDAGANYDGIPTPKGAPRILGDVILAAETVQREAGELGYTDQEMFYFYLIHGLLHLIGYDHELGEDEAKRQEAETERLWQLIDHEM